MLGWVVSLIDLIAFINNFCILLVNYSSLEWVQQNLTKPLKIPMIGSNS